MEGSGVAVMEMASTPIELSPGFASGLIAISKLFDPAMASKTKISRVHAVVDGVPKIVGVPSAVTV